MTARGSIGESVTAQTLAGLSGVIGLAIRLFRLGFGANFLSHPVNSGQLAMVGGEL